jgi:hypothetical protein
MRIKELMVALLAAALLIVSVAGPASAQEEQDGLVNVRVGDVTIEDVNVAVAANIVAQACDVARNVVVGVIADIDAGERNSKTFCKVEDGQVRVTQN